MSEQPPSPAEPPNIWMQYRERFDAGPPMLAWMGDQDAIEALMDDALRTGRRLTPHRLWRVQGYEPPSPDANW